MQQIEKNEAIVLRIIPFSETSQIVTWLTPDRGRIATMVKGARRAKSPFLGQYDQFYTCELVYYLREHAGIHIARECFPLKTRSNLRTQWRATAIASYAVDLTGKASLEGGHQQELYDLLQFMLDFLSQKNTLAETPPRIAIIFWLELHLLATLGFAPHLKTCTDCGRTIHAGHSAHYSFRRNGVVCNQCPTTESQSQLLLRPDVLAILNIWAKSSTPKSAANTVLNKDQVFALRLLFDTLLEQLAGVKTTNRQWVEEALVN
ncbi:MAG: DNA repair protein RecO [Kiritimatiellae bacterium]|nr:DNA repair protein RecO [Kiritimatiellia bacterium]